MEPFGLTNRLIQAGVVHPSNGRSGELSLSWNPVFAKQIFERDNFDFGLEPWLRIQEDREDADNLDIEDHLGYFEFQGGTIATSLITACFFGIRSRTTVAPFSLIGAACARPSAGQHPIFLRLW